MSDRFRDEPPNSGRLRFIIIILVITMALWFTVNVGIFDDPKEEVEGIVVRFILIFKQSMLI